MLNPLNSITVKDLYQLQQTPAAFTLVDVREPSEYAICHLESLLIPLAQLPQRLHELDKNKLIVVYCKADLRSQHAAAFLQQAGFSQVVYLKGGILAWAAQMDVTMAQLLYG